MCSVKPETSYTRLLATTIVSSVNINIVLDEKTKQSVQGLTIYQSGSTV